MFFIRNEFRKISLKFIIENFKIVRRKYILVFGLGSKVLFII